MSSPSRAPTRLSAWLAAAAGLASVVSSGFGSWIGLAIGAPGLLVVLIGIRSVSRRTLSVGALGLCAAGLAAGVEGVPTGLVLTSVLGSVLAWDLGTTAITLGVQVGADADTARLELVHAAGSLAVGLGAAIGAVVLYLAVPDAPSPTALLVLLVAVGFLLLAVRHSSVGT